MGDFVPTIAVDFDGVVHRYSRGWQDGSIYDPPMPGALEALERLRAEGFRLVLFTTRSRTGDQLAALYAWLEQHGIDHELFDDVTDRKPLALLYIDDRGLRFENWPQALEQTLAILRPSGLDRASAAVDKARGGPPPVAPQGYA